MNLPEDPVLRSEVASAVSVSIKHTLIAGVAI